MPFPVLINKQFPTISNPSASNASSPLTTPTSDGSSEAIHPSVVDVEVTKGVGQTWNGYRYWMAMTPFTDGDIAVEDPEILASNDGTTWVVPDGLTNPIDGTPSRLHHADTELILGQDDVMYCYYIDVAESTPDTVGIRVMSSSNGTTWGSETELFSGSDTNASPAVIWDGSQYVMYYVDYSAAPYSLRYRTCATPMGTWSSENACNIENIPDGFNIWNIHMVKNGSDYHAFIGMFEDPKPIYFANSYDGLRWRVQDDPMLEVGTAGAWDDGFLYRACGTIISGGYDLWYSANNDPTTWVDGHIGRTTVTL